MKTKFFILMIGFLFVADVLAANTCYNPRTECIEPEDTRVFGPDIDIPVRLPCWKYKTTYECKENNEDELSSGQEEAGPLTKTCEHVPNILVEEEVFPGCQRHISPGSIEDCLAGQVQIPHYRGTGHGKIVLPKNRGARVGFSDSKHPYCYITITNETTGQQIVPKRRVSNGYYIELPTSQTQDQIFSFVVDRWDRCTCNQPGHMNIYINYLRKIPKLEWSETNCNEN